VEGAGNFSEFLLRLPGAVGRTRGNATCRAQAAVTLTLCQPVEPLGAMGTRLSVCV
jgi:hypothetical protein